MALTKADIVRSVKQEIRFRKQPKDRQGFLFPEWGYVGLNNRQANRLVEALFELIKESLVKGEDVEIRKFGKFQVKYKWARRGRNPQSGEMIILPSRRVVTFRASRVLRKKINQA